MMSFCLSTAFLDPEWFTFDTAGTLVAGMDGMVRQENKSGGHHAAAFASRHNTTSVPPAARPVERTNTAVSGIEMAAAATTGMFTNIWTCICYAFLCVCVHVHMRVYARMCAHVCAPQIVVGWLFIMCISSSCI